MSGYLELARRGRARREEYWHCPASEAVVGIQPVCHNLSIQLVPEDRRLQSAGFELKERAGKIVWERPDTGFWESQETTALHPLKRESTEEGRRA
jgi:hypothetical protein